jgi:cytochrome P450
MAFAAGGAYHRALRNAATPLFHTASLEAAAPSMCAAADELVEAVLNAFHPSSDDGCARETDIHALLSNTTLDVIGLCALGAPMGAQRAACGKGSAPLAAAAMTVFQCLEPLSGDGRVNDRWALCAAMSPRCAAPLWRLVAAVAPAAAVKRLHIADDTVRAAAQRLLATARTAIANGSAFAPGAPLTLFGVLTGEGAAAAAARHGIPPLTDEQIVAQAHTFLLAGAETTASALACAVYLLACTRRPPRACAPRLTQRLLTWQRRRRRSPRCRTPRRC